MVLRHGRQSSGHQRAARRPDLCDAGDMEELSPDAAPIARHCA